MNHLSRLLLLFTIILVEGYVVLSTELLAIRETLPFVGSGTDTVSIIIAAVLMPLAFGYHAGGQHTQRQPNGSYISLRKRLVKNLMISQAILFVGLSYVLLSLFFQTLIESGLSNRLLLTALYAACFLVVPVYLLGQTVPLISNYFSKRKLSDITGKMLFFSTLGSFLGATLSTLVLMSIFGVHVTVTVNFFLLAILVLLLEKNKMSERVLLSWGIAFCGLYLNSGSIMESFHIVKDNKYNTIAVVEENGKRHLILNNSFSSMYSDKGDRYELIKFMEHIAIDSIPKEDPAKDILVIGAGAFTLGHGDLKNNYTFVDIDKDLKPVAEQYILKEKLPPNVTFYPEEARAFLMREKKKYDIIVLDTYFGFMTIPEHLMTADYFLQIKNHIKEGGLVLTNLVVSPNMTNPLSQNLYNTFHAVFPHTTMEVIGHNHHLWDKDTNALENVIYIYKHNENARTDTIYTDNKNSVFYDKSAKLHRY